MGYNSFMTKSIKRIRSIIRPLSILNCAIFFQYQRFVMPISFLFYLHNGLTFSQFILCQSMYNATCLIAKLLFGFIGDIFSKKYVIIMAYLLFMLRVILWINFSGFAIILAGEILYGLFKAFYKGNVDSYVYEWLEQNNIKHEMIAKYGKLAFFNSLGSAVSCVLGVILFKFYDFKALLYLELFTQVIAVTCLLFLPNTKSLGKVDILQYIKTVFGSIKRVITDCKINYYVFYSGLLSGLTNVFVWNFQPLLKLSNAPVFFYGAVSFVNQILRGLGAWNAKKFIKKLSNKSFIKIEYGAVILSFLLLFAAHIVKNYIFVLFALLIICFMILSFVAFNIFTVSKIHEYTQDYNRAMTSSTNTFVEDFMSVFLLLGFKTLYDKLGFTYSVLISMFVVIIVLFPRMKAIQKSS